MRIQRVQDDLVCYVRLLTSNQDANNFRFHPDGKGRSLTADGDGEVMGVLGWKCIRGLCPPPRLASCYGGCPVRELKNAQA